MSITQKHRLRALLIALSALAVAMAGALAIAPSASSHGTATSPPSRQYSCWERWGDDHLNPDMDQVDPMCAQAWQANPNTMWNWNGLLREGMAGNHEGGIPDGALCSGGHAEGGRYDTLDEVGPWHTTPLDNNFTLHYEDTAVHGGDYYWVYVTRQGYNPATQPLTWSNLERVAETGVIEPGDPVDIPVSAPGRTGHHVVYVVWQASHIDQTFYSCSDVDFGGDGSDPTDPPTDPTDPPTDPTDPPTDPTDPPEGDCTAAINVTNDWGSGWQANVSVSATGGALSGWTLTWTWPGSQSIQSSWNTELSTSGSTVTASDAGWNGSIASGESREVFGFISNGSSASPAVTCTAS